MARGDVCDHLGDEEGVVFRPLVGVHGVIAGLLLESVETADACGDDDTHAVLVEGLVVLDAGVLDSLTGGHQRVLGVKVELAQFLAVDMVGAVESLDLTGKLCLEKGSVEVGNWAGSGHSVDGVLP